MILEEILGGVRLQVLGVRACSLPRWKTWIEWNLKPMA